MRIRLISVQSKKEPWFEELLELYTKKLKAYFHSFEYLSLKAKSMDRKDREIKRKLESDLILSKIQEKDFVVLCDERGKSFSSLAFAEKLQSVIDSSPSEIVFVVGGAYGVDERVRERAQMQWALSDMVMNHLLAQAVVLEQIYRASTIWKGIPYHNE